MKLLLGGIRGKVGGRTDKVREAYPHRCQGKDCDGNTCGFQGIMLTWTTTAPNVPGHAWCAICAGSPDTATAGAPPCPPPAARARRRARGKQHP
eukprot:14701212-Heterocapsa_arctica.AAC.1